MSWVGAVRLVLDDPLTRRNRPDHPRALYRLHAAERRAIPETEPSAHAAARASSSPAQV
jgi:hypothetical protein